MNKEKFKELNDIRIKIEEEIKELSEERELLRLYIRIGGDFPTQRKIINAIQKKDVEIEKLQMELLIGE